MNPSVISHGRRLWDGSLRGFLTEALALPAGLITAAVLSRGFGPEKYGALTLVVVIVSWIESGITSAFARSTIKFIGERNDWSPIAGHLVRLQLAAGFLAGALLFVSAPAVAAILRQSELTPLLRLLSVDIPLFTLAGAHRSILIGRGLYRPKAVLSAVRHVSRVVFLLLFVRLNFGLPGVLLSFIAGSVFEFAAARFYVRPSLRKIHVKAPELWQTAGWLFLFAVTLRLYERIDLLMLKFLGSSIAEIGYYGAATNLCHIPVSLVSVSFSPLLLSSLTRALRDEDSAGAQSLIRLSLSSIWLILPISFLISACSGIVTQTIYGPAFAPTATIMVILIFASAALLYTAICTAILTAVDKARLTFLIAAAMVLANIASQLFLIPVLGMAGAAVATTATAISGALAAWISVRSCLSRQFQSAASRITISA